MNVATIRPPIGVETPAGLTATAVFTEGKVLAATNLQKSYGGRQVLRDVSFELRQGEAVGLLGPNGAGKTTSFYMVTGLVAVDGGRISLGGKDMTDLPIHRRALLGIGYLPQEASVFRGLSVEDNILAVLEVAETNRNKRLEKLEELLEEFGLVGLRHAKAITLSGGERRRVEIARALATDPAFILLDEPLAGIDPINVAEIRHLVGHLRNRGLGVLITDHNVRDTLDIVDRAYILHDGGVVREGTPAEVIADPLVKRVYLGDSFSR